MVFIDAAVGKEDWSIRKISLGEHRAPLNYVFHALYPEELLRLMKLLYGKAPKAWISSIKGEDFSFGTGLSPKTKSFAEEAEIILESLIRSELKDA
ncbi:MAG: hypothetical protein PWQ16_1550 [bacterium]|nr:hypothetical protein [bacterium]